MGAEEAARVLHEFLTFRFFPGDTETLRRVQTAVNVIRDRCGQAARLLENVPVRTDQGYLIDNLHRLSGRT